VADEDNDGPDDDDVKRVDDFLLFPLSCYVS